MMNCAEDQTRLPSRWRPEKYTGRKPKAAFSDSTVMWPATSRGSGASVSAYVLHLEGLLPEDASLDAAALPRVAMPNRDGFTADPRPDVPAPAARPTDRTEAR